MRNYFFNYPFAPSKIAISGPTEGIVGNVITMSCAAGPSNPASRLSWVIDDKVVPTTTSEVEVSKGGWLTTSNVTVTLTRQLFRHEGEEPLLCRSSLQTTFTSGRRISATTVRNHLHNAGLYARRPVVCVPLNGRQRRNRLCWAREHVSWTQQRWVSVLFTDESRFTMESDSGRLLIWREERTRYHQSNTVERHSYRGGGILVWAGISLGGHTDLHVFHGGTVTGLRYRDEILDPYVRPYAAAIGNDIILMDDNARPHRARIVEEYLEDHGLERMEWPARSPDLNPIEHLWDYLGREVAALNPPPRSLHELKQGLLCVWSSLPIPVSDNLINSMGNRCRQCIQVSGHIP
ncbi:transposable element Tcb2 transposase [Trichonephila clavipes]|nr:transposable element Tcb2 transposase [Trichonephila clavipes]